MKKKGLQISKKIILSGLEKRILTFIEIPLVSGNHWLFSDCPDVSLLLLLLLLLLFVFKGVSMDWNGKP